MQMHDIPDLSVGKLHIKKTNSYKVNRSLRKLNHGYSREIAKLFVVFESFENVINFKIDYTITAANLPEAVSGQLHVSVEKSGS